MTTEATTVAQTILSQLGGGRFAVMTGARNFTAGQGASDYGKLTFRIPQAKQGINTVTITLMPSDTYTVEFSRITAKGKRVIETLEDVYCDMLQEVFTRATGLYTHF